MQGDQFFLHAQTLLLAAQALVLKLRVFSFGLAALGLAALPQAQIDKQHHDQRHRNPGNQPWLK